MHPNVSVFFPFSFELLRSSLVQSFFSLFWKQGEVDCPEMLTLRNILWMVVREVLLELWMSSYHCIVLSFDRLQRVLLDW
jgi:hypothetical protein